MDALRTQSSDLVESGTRTIAVPGSAVVDFSAGAVLFDGSSFTFAPLKRVAQELVVHGGAEAVVRERLERA